MLVTLTLLNVYTMLNVGPPHHICAEKHAISNAQKSLVDLSKCTLYTTLRPCLECTKITLQAGIRVVIWGVEDDKMERAHKEAIDSMVY